LRTYRPPSDEPFRTDLPSELNVPKTAWPLSRRLKWIGIGLAIPAVAGGLAYLLRGGSVWEILSIVLAVLLGFLSLAVLKEWVTSLSRDGLQPRLLLFLLYCWAVLGVWYGVGLLLVSGVVYVDNASARSLQIELDGQPWRSSHSDQLQQVNVRRGEHRIAVRPKEGGAPLQELTVRVEGKGKYVLNVLKAQTYYKGSVQYGGFAFFGGGGISPQAVRDEWIDVTKVDYLFEDPPRSIKVQVQKGLEGIHSETRSYFTRGKPPRDPGAP
jgi:hypothetical protein